MLLGTVICVFAMLLLGFTRSVASIFTALGSHSVGLIARPKTSWLTFSQNDVVTIWLAIFAIYLIDFSINVGEHSRSKFKDINILTDVVVQAVDRALLVDTIPSSEQASGNAWAARMLGVGSVIGFFV